MVLSLKNVLLGAQAYLAHAHVLCPMRMITGAKLSNRQNDSDSLSWATAQGTGRIGEGGRRGLTSMFNRKGRKGERDGGI